MNRPQDEAPRSIASDGAATGRVAYLRFVTDASWQLAEFNIARLRQPLDHPDTAPFVEALDMVNALAESSPGFVWRLQDESGQSSSYVRAYDDPLTIINLSVWESPDALRDFVFRTSHTSFLRRRREWFERMDVTYLVCWWVVAGTAPTVADAVERLDHLHRDGPSADAFTLRDPFPSPTVRAGRHGPGRGGRRGATAAG